MRKGGAGVYLALAAVGVLLATMAIIGLTWLKKHPRSQHPAQPFAQTPAPTEPAAKPAEKPVSPPPATSANRPPTAPPMLDDCVQSMETLISGIENDTSILRDQRPVFETFLDPAAKALTDLETKLKNQPEQLKIPLPACSIPASGAVTVETLRAGMGSILQADASIKALNSTKYGDVRGAWTIASQNLQAISNAIPDDFLTAVEEARQDAIWIFRAPDLHHPSPEKEESPDIDQNLISAMSNLDQAKTIWIRTRPEGHFSPQPGCEPAAGLESCRTHATDAIQKALEIGKDGALQEHLNDALKALKKLDTLPAPDPAARFKPYIPVASLSLALLSSLCLLIWLGTGPLKNARHRARESEAKLRLLEAEMGEALTRVAKLESQSEPARSSYNSPTEEKTMPSFEPLSKGFRQKTPSTAANPGETEGSPEASQEALSDGANMDNLIEVSPIPRRNAPILPDRTESLLTRIGAPSPEPPARTAHQVRDVVADYNHAKTMRPDERDSWFSSLYSDCQNVSCPNLEKSRSVSVALHFEPNSRGNFLLVKTGVLNYYVFPRLTDDLASARRSLEGAFTYPAAFSGALQVRSAAHSSSRTTVRVRLSRSEAPPRRS